MSTKTVEQRAARAAQKKLDCSYNAALLVARSKEALDEARQDTSSRPFRLKLEDVVVRRMQTKQ